MLGHSPISSRPISDVDRIAHAARVSQLPLEIGAFATPAARVSWAGIEAGAFATPAARVSQLTVNFGGFGTPEARVSWLGLEAGAFGLPRARASKIVLEFLVHNHRVDPPPIYPDLPGQPGFSLVKRPKFLTSDPQTHTSGREVIVAYDEYPLWEFELTYEVLRDRATDSELRTFLGFFLSPQGVRNGFLLRDKDDNQVRRQTFATTDGAASQFGPLVRTIGANGNFGTEPVGYVDKTQPFNLYRDGVLVDPSDATWGYSVLRTQPVAQYVKFNNTPPTGHVLTVDMSYFYYVRFSDNSFDFEKFMHQLYTVKTVKLVSKRK